MNFTLLGYIILFLPGFVLIWTFRKFAKNTKEIKDIEYLAWSFLWGFFINLIIIPLINLRKVEFPNYTIHNDFEFIAVITGFSLAISLLAFIFGLIGAILSQMGIFERIDKKIHAMICFLAKK
jgi:uncharacterized membrane protein